MQGTMVKVHNFIRNKENQATKPVPQLGVRIKDE